MTATLAALESYVMLFFILAENFKLGALLVDWEVVRTNKPQQQTSWLTLIANSCSIVCSGTTISRALDAIAPGTSCTSSHPF